MWKDFANPHDAVTGQIKTWEHFKLVSCCVQGCAHFLDCIRSAHLQQLCSQAEAARSHFPPASG